MRLVSKESMVLHRWENETLTSVVSNMLIRVKFLLWRDNKADILRVSHLSALKTSALLSPHGGNLTPINLLDNKF